MGLPLLTLILTSVRELARRAERAAPLSPVRRRDRDHRRRHSRHGGVDRRLPVAELVLRASHPHVHHLELARRAWRSSASWSSRVSSARWSISRRGGATTRCERRLKRGRWRRWRAPSYKIPSRCRSWPRSSSTSFQLEGVAIFGDAGDDWHVEAAAGRNPPAIRSRRRSRSRSPRDRSWRGPAASSGHVIGRCSARSRPSWRLALHGRRLQAEAAARNCAGEGERAPHRAARCRQSRPADTTCVDTCRGHEPAERRDRLGPRCQQGATADDRRRSRAAEHARRQPSRHEPAADGQRDDHGAAAIGIEEIVASAIVGLHVPPDESKSTSPKRCRG